MNDLELKNLFYFVLKMALVVGTLMFFGASLLMWRQADLMSHKVRTAIGKFIVIVNLIETLSAFGFFVIALWILLK